MNSPFRLLTREPCVRHSASMKPEDDADGLAIRLDALRAELPQLDHFRPAAVYLFGSLSRGAGHRDSDIDLAFLPGGPCDPVEVFETANRLAAKFGRQVDLVDLRRASTVMRKEVLRTGKLLHESDPARRMEFEMLALSDYARLNEERQPILNKLSTTAA